MFQMEKVNQKARKNVVVQSHINAPIENGLQQFNQKNGIQIRLKF